MARRPCCCIGLLLAVVHRRGRARRDRARRRGARRLQRAADPRRARRRAGDARRLPAAVRAAAARRAREPAPPRARRRTWRSARRAARATAPRNGARRRARRASPTRALGAGARPRDGARRDRGPARARGARATARRRGGARAARRDAGDGRASGGEYSGPLAYRQGKPMRPDVALAFDRMAAAARARRGRAVVTSGFRSDAEQARLFAAPPRPEVGRAAGQVAAPPRHRARPRPAVAPTAGWPRTRRGSASSSATLGALALRLRPQRRHGVGRLPRGDGGRDAGAAVLRAARASRRRSRGRRSAGTCRRALLAAQLYAESDFNPFARSPAGAQGIAQFMPGTARGYGLANPSTPTARSTRRRT